MNGQDFYEIEKDYRSKKIMIIKFSEIQRVPLAEIQIDFNKYKLLHKVINPGGAGRFKEPKEEDLYYFDYGHDLKWIYDEIKEFYEQIEGTEITFYDIEENLGVPLFKYLKLKLSYYSIEVMNQFYECELLLYSNRLVDLTLEDLKMIYNKIEDNYYIEEMVKVSKKTLELLKVNISKVLEYIYYAEYLYNDLNYDIDLIDEFFDYLNRYDILTDYPNYLKCVEVLRHNTDLYTFIDFIKYCSENNYMKEQFLLYINNHLKKCRAEVNRRERYSENIMTKLLEEHTLKEMTIKHEEQIDERSDDLFNLLIDGYITEFSEFLLELREVYSIEDYNDLVEMLKTKINNKII